MPTSIDTDALTGLGLTRQTQTQAAAPDELGQEEFFKLMIAQLRNQDPFSPMESGEFLGQIAQFGTVSGIEEVRSALVGLTAAMSANQTMQAAGLVDREALVPSREAWLPPEGEIRGAVEIPAGTSSAIVGIYDLNGGLVATRALDVGGDAPGEFTWDGMTDEGEPAPSGYYELRASGDLGGSNTSLDVLVAGRVESVSLQDAGGTITLTVTGLGQINLTDIRRVS